VKPFFLNSLPMESLTIDALNSTEEAPCARAALTAPASILERVPAGPATKLRGNRLRHIPEEIGKLTKLSHISARKEQLDRLPDSIGSLSELTELDISGNRITALLSMRGTKLWSLFASDNRIASLPSYNFGKATTCRFSRHQRWLAHREA
jgi:Leucine-rich repeat (LRR) protein